MVNTLRVMSWAGSLPPRLSRGRVRILLGHGLDDYATRICARISEPPRGGCTRFARTRGIRSALQRPAPRDPVRDPRAATSKDDVVAGQAPTAVVAKEHVLTACQVSARIALVRGRCSSARQNRDRRRTHLWRRRSRQAGEGAERRAQPELCPAPRAQTRRCQSGSSGIVHPGSRPSSTARVIAAVPNRSRTSSSAASSASLP